MTPWGQMILLATLKILLFVDVPSCEGACMYNLTSSSGSLRSPNFPEPYPGGTRCLWHINLSNVTNVDGIILTFHHFVTQETNSVTLFEEELLIYEANPSYSNSTPYIYRGGNTYSTPLVEIWVSFTSSNNLSTSRRGSSEDRLGFFITYTAIIPGVECIPPAVNINTIRDGRNFSVGSYVTYYCNAGYRLVGYNVLLCVLDNSGTASWSSPSPVCLDTCPEPHVNNGHAQYTSLAINTTTSFTCDPPYYLNGRPRIHCILSNRGFPLWTSPFPKCTLAKCSQGLTIIQFPGYIVDPDYGNPNPVLRRIDCLWKLQATNGHVIKISYRYFDLPVDSHVDVYDVRSARLLLQRTAGGEGIPRNVTSRSNRVEIVYRRPRSNATTNRGFYIYYDMGSPNILGQGDGDHGTLTPFLPTFTTPKPTPSRRVGINVVDDGASTIKIAVGVAIPVVIMLAVVLGLYLWYRKKYPVRMIIGREFAKFSNPDYSVKSGHSTLTLVREDAEDFFKTASRATSNVNLVMNTEYGPHYVNPGFIHEDDELHDQEYQPIDQDQQDRELMERKKYLFSHMDMFDGVKENRGMTSGSGSDDNSVSNGSQESKNTLEVEATVELDQHTQSSEPTNNQRIQLDAVNSFNTNFPCEFPRKTSLTTLIDRSRDRRAFTNEELPTRRFSVDMGLSARRRSQSAKTPEEFTKEANKLDILLMNCPGNVTRDLTNVSEEDSNGHSHNSDCVNVDVYVIEAVPEESCIPNVNAPSQVYASVESQSINLNDQGSINSSNVQQVNSLQADEEHSTCGDVYSHDNSNESLEIHPHDQSKDVHASFERTPCKDSEEFIGTELCKETVPCKETYVREVSDTCEETNPFEKEVPCEKSDPSVKSDPCKKPGPYKEVGPCEKSDPCEKTEPRKEADLCEKTNPFEKSDTCKEAGPCEKADPCNSHTQSTIGVPSSFPKYIDESTLCSDSSSEKHVLNSDLTEHNFEKVCEITANESKSVHRSRKIGSVVAPNSQDVVDITFDIQQSRTAECNSMVTTEVDVVDDGELEDDNESQYSTDSHASGGYDFDEAAHDSNDEAVDSKFHNKGHSNNHNSSPSEIVHTKSESSDGVNSTDITPSNNTDIIHISTCDQLTEPQQTPTDKSDKPQNKKIAAPVFNMDDDSSDDSSKASDDEVTRRSHSTSSPLYCTAMTGIQETDESRGLHGTNSATDFDLSDDEDGMEFTHDDILAALSDDDSYNEIKPRFGDSVTIGSSRLAFDEDDDLSV